MNKTLTISSAGKTDIGLKRKKNEDRFLIIDNAQSGYGIDCLGKMFAVADGMGGHLGGEAASRMACEILPEHYHKNIPENQVSSESLIARLEHTIQTAGKRIASASFENRELSGMGTTLSVLLLHEENALIAHVGDSRIYRLRSNELKQLTADHTQVQEMVNLGQMTPEEAAYSPLRHILTQAVGMARGPVAVELRIEPIQKNDVFLLCSDGLHDMVYDDTIKEILLKAASPQVACETLIAEALKQGGKDNITVVVVFCK